MKSFLKKRLKNREIKDNKIMMFALNSSFYCFLLSGKDGLSIVEKKSALVKYDADENDRLEVALGLIQSIKSDHYVSSISIAFQNKEVIIRDLKAVKNSSNSDLENLLEINLRHIRSFDIKKYTTYFDKINDEKFKFKKKYLANNRDLSSNSGLDENSDQNIIEYRCKAIFNEDFNFFRKLCDKADILCKELYLLSDIFSVWNDDKSSFSNDEKDSAWNSDEGESIKGDDNIENIMCELNQENVIFTFDSKGVSDFMFLDARESDDYIKNFFDMKNTLKFNFEDDEDVLKLCEISDSKKSKSMNLLNKTKGYILKKNMLLVMSAVSCVLLVFSCILYFMNFRLANTCNQEINTKIAITNSDKKPKITGFRHLYGLCFDKIDRIIAMDDIYVDRLMTEEKKVIASVYVLEKEKINSIIEELRQKNVSIKMIESERLSIPEIGILKKIKVYEDNSKVGSNKCFINFFRCYADNIESETVDELDSEIVEEKYIENNKVKFRRVEKNNSINNDNKLKNDNELKNGNKVNNGNNINNNVNSVRDNQSSSIYNSQKDSSNTDLDYKNKQNVYKLEIEFDI